jgi:lysyl endopeptidase
MSRFYSQILALLVCCAAFSNASAQINYGGTPSFIHNTSELSATRIHMSSIDRAGLAAEDAVTDLIKEVPWRFGVENDVNFTPSTHGYWNEEGDENVWRLAITGEDATSISIRFSEFGLEKGAYLFVWSRTTGDFIGKFDHRSVKEWGGLATGVVTGSEVIVELHQPISRGTTAPIGIDQIVYGYRSLLIRAEAVALEMRGPFGNSGACNINVNCPEGAPWATESRSVALIVEGGWAACTGALINNTANDGTPYFLTANHCLGNPGNWLYYFNHETAGCTGTTGPTNQSVSGGTTLVSNASSDYGLVLLSETPPASFNVQYAGFDASGVNPSSACGIHHPSGDLKKICFEEDSPYQTNAAGAAVWMIDQWEAGVTEPGSSGSPLFDNNHRIIGQLFGGSAACNGSVNNGQLDYYGRLDVSWGNGASEYLDPSGSGITVWDGYPDGAVAYDYDAGVSITGAPDGLLCGAATIELDIVLTNSGSNNLTSATITYNINGTSAQQINWNGNLSQYESETISIPPFTAVSGENTVSVTVSNPNGNSDENSLNNSANAEFSTISGETMDFQLALTLDEYGSEVTWELKQLSTVLYEGGPYEDVEGGELVIVDFCLAEGCYIFNIYDDYGDGICCEYGVGHFEILDPQGDVIHASNGEYGEGETETFCTEEAFVGEANAPTLTIFPNPASSTLTIATPSSDGQLEICDASGRIMTSIVHSNELQTMIDVSSYAEGMYFVTWTNSKGERSVSQIGVTH